MIRHIGSITEDIHVAIHSQVLTAIHSEVGFSTDVDLAWNLAVWSLDNTAEQIANSLMMALWCAISTH